MTKPLPAPRRHALLALLPLLAAACSTPRAAVAARYGTLDPDGDISIRSTVGGGKNDLDRAGFEKDEGVLGGRFDFQWTSPHLTVHTQQSEHDGDGVLDATVSDGSTVIPAGTPVAVDMDLGLHVALLTFDFFPGESFELGLGFGATAIDLEAAVTSKATGARVDTDEVLPVPLLAARAGVDIGNLNLSALAGGMGWRWEGDEATYLDVDLMARFRLIGGNGAPFGALIAGYRFVKADLDYEEGGEDVEADLRLDGPYFGLALGF